ncbi:MAG: hypothetical protein FD138_256 [Planctomycetota bacterium]|nr:MAG: hypothetical protein FD138_256 [Planctomycetota bacterium]
MKNEKTDGNDGKHGNDENHNSHSSQKSHQPVQPQPAPPPDVTRVLPPRGDYQTLLSFLKAEVVYDITFRFAHKHLSKGDRTIDQMIQSARSGKQNILEGSKAGTTSKETEIKLTNVGRASLEELLADDRDYLRVRDLPLWDKDSKEALFVRELGRKVPQTFEVYREFVETRPAEVIANIAICLIHQTNYLLDQQLKTLEKEFLEQGGLRERMTRARLNYRNQRPKD